MRRKGAWNSDDRNCGGLLACLTVSIQWRGFFLEIPNPLLILSTFHPLGNLLFIGFQNGSTFTLQLPYILDTVMLCFWLDK